MRHIKPLILVDIDGTLALRQHRAPHDHARSFEDAVNWPIVQLCEALVQSGSFDLLLVSERQECFRGVTERWLNHHRILTTRLGLFMRQTGDTRPDDIVKMEIYQTIIAPHAIVHAVIDDRDRVVKTWRRIGLPCLQVAEGKSEVRANTARFSV